MLRVFHILVYNVIDLHDVSETDPTAVLTRLVFMTHNRFAICR
jgi:hypothetical protein